MSTTRIAINGFGRIGRLTARILLTQHQDIEIVAVNDLTSPENLAYLFSHDSTYHAFEYPVQSRDNAIIIQTPQGEKTIRVFAEKDPSLLPWDQLGIDVVLECTGRFLTQELAQSHITAGAKRVILSAPAKDTSIPTIVLGVNHELLQSQYKDNQIFSNASCTTNCIAPALKVLEDSFGISSVSALTVHAYTATQVLQDGPSQKEWRDGRAAAINMIPSKTGAAKAVELVLPTLTGKLHIGSLRVPIITGSVVYITAQVNTDITLEAVNNAFETAANAHLNGILEYSTDNLVSSDIVKNPHSSIIDSQLSDASGQSVTVTAWYDNEWGYANRLAELIKLVFPNV